MRKIINIINFVSLQESLSEEGVFSQNSDPVDADFDVLCTDDMCLSDDAQNHTYEDVSHDS